MLETAQHRVHGTTGKVGAFHDVQAEGLALRKCVEHACGGECDSLHFGTLFYIVIVLHYIVRGAKTDGFTNHCALVDEPPCKVLWQIALWMDLG